MDKSLLDRSKLIISSTWTVQNPDKNLQNSVSVGVLNESLSIEEIVCLDSCIHLICPEGDDCIGCTVYIRFSEPSLMCICKLVAVSEARMVEVYGDCGEYCTTCQGDYIDDFEGCAVYKADTSFQSTQEVLLKFAGLKHKRQMWIYGIRLLVKQTDKVHGIANVNFQKVNERLKESKIPISDKAEKCKKFLQSYGGFSDAKMQSKSPDPQILLKLLEAQCVAQLKPLSETGRKCLSNLMPFLSNKEEKDQQSCENKVSTSDTSSRSSLDLQELKQYVDLRIEELEHNLYTKLDNRLKQIEIKQNEKLDNILRTLQNSNL